MTAAKTMFPVRRLTVFLVLLLLGSGVLLAVRAPLSMPPVRSNSHAVERHGSDAIEIRRCLDRNGPADVWKKFKVDRYILLCRLDDGRWGIQIIEKVGAKYEEITSFVRGNGTLRETTDYLMKQGTRWKGLLPR
jgi:hypothetical protein